MILFEIILKEGISADSLLSDDVKQSTGAQIMTPAEAAFVGLEGIPDDPQDRPRALIACSPADERLILTRVENNEGVAAIRKIQLG